MGSADLPKYKPETAEEDVIWERAVKHINHGKRTLT